MFGANDGSRSNSGMEPKLNSGSVPGLEGELASRLRLSLSLESLGSLSGTEDMLLVLPLFIYQSVPSNIQLSTVEFINKFY